MKNQILCEVKIRGMKNSAKEKLQEFAKSEGKSLNEFCREQLELIAVAPELNLANDKFATLVELVINKLDVNTDAIKSMEKRIEMLESKVDSLSE